MTPPGDSPPGRPSRPARSARGPQAAIRLLAEDDGLAHDPRLVSDPRLLGALHAELEDRLGPDDAALTLLQLGFLHGLRDGTRVLRAGLLDTARPGASPAPSAPLLAIRLDGLPLAAAMRGAIEVTGAWPEQVEAGARGAFVVAGRLPACFLSAGYTSGWLSGIFEADVLAIERRCAARGEGECRFVAREAEAWLGDDDPRARVLLEGLPFAALRDQLGRELATQMGREMPASFDPSSPAVHVWGPVMVLPFSGLEESLRAVDLIGRDAAAREVAVVVIDLSGALIDEGFGAVALETVLDAVEAWGAEPILTGVSPLSDATVADLQRGRLVVRKDLPEAIATAFQIAHAQRRFL